jgi:hypothetical protein
VIRLPLSIVHVPIKPPTRYVPSASYTTVSATELTQLGAHNVTSCHVPTTSPPHAVPPQVVSIAEHVSSPLPPPPPQPRTHARSQNVRIGSPVSDRAAVMPVENVAESLWSTTRRDREFTPV